MKQYTVDDHYRELALEVINEHEELQWILTSDVRIDFISSDEEKKKSDLDVLGECMKVKDVYKLYCPFDFLIILYAPNIAHLTEEKLKILLHHELLHVGIDEVNGEAKYIINPHDIEDFRAIINEYGLDWAR